MKSLQRSWSGPVLLAACASLCACSGDEAASGGSGDLVQFLEGPPAGNVEGETCDVPADGAAANTSVPDHVVGTGTAASCTADAFIAAVAQRRRDHASTAARAR